MRVCACMGAIGSDPYCPCEMERRGLKVSITESYISPEVWQSMSDEDKQTINSLKAKAAFACIFKEKE